MHCRWLCPRSCLVLWIYTSIHCWHWPGNMRWVPKGAGCEDLKVVPFVKFVPFPSSLFTLCHFWFWVVMWNLISHEKFTYSRIDSTFFMLSGCVTHLLHLKQHLFNNIHLRVGWICMEYWWYSCSLTRGIQFRKSDWSFQFMSFPIPFGMRNPSSRIFLQWVASTGWRFLSIYQCHPVPLYPILYRSFARARWSN